MKTKKDYIIINGSKFEFERIPWSAGQDAINQETALEALKIIYSILPKYDIKPYLLWGTLLGAIREHGFIPHDNDLDLGILQSEVKSLEKAIPELYANNVMICKYKKGFIYTFMYKGVTCDVDVFRKTFFPYSLGYGVILEEFIPKRLFRSFEEYLFCGLKTYIPSNPEALLEYTYGKDWRIPKKGGSGMLTPKWMVLERLYYKIRRKIKYIRCKKFGYDDPDFF